MGCETFFIFDTLGVNARRCFFMSASNNEVAVISTTQGELVVEFWSETAPKTVENFKKLANDAFYDGTCFHRIVKGFMIQGGGFEPGLKKKDTNDPIQNEADNGLQNLVGTLAMARTNDPHSATAQFFINTADNHFLNHTDKNPRGWGYAVFGQVISGMDVVRQIEGSTTGQRDGMGDVPLEDVEIQKIQVD